MSYHLDHDNLINVSVSETEDNLSLIYKGDCTNYRFMYEMIKDIPEIKLRCEIIDPFTVAVYSNLDSRQAEQLVSSTYHKVDVWEQAVITAPVSNYTIMDYAAYYPTIKCMDVGDAMLWTSTTMGGQEIANRLNFTFLSKLDCQCDEVIKSMASFILMRDHHFIIHIEYRKLVFTAYPCSEVFGVKLVEEMIEVIQNLERMNIGYRPSHNLYHDELFIHEKLLYCKTSEQKIMAETSNKFYPFIKWVDGDIQIKDQYDQVVPLEALGYKPLKPKYYSVEVGIFKVDEQIIISYRASSGLQQDVVVLKHHNEEQIERIIVDIKSGAYFSPLMKALMYQHPEWVPSLEPTL